MRFTGVHEDTPHEELTFVAANDGELLVEEEDVLFQGHHIEIMLMDVYFLTGLPMLGVVGDLALVLSRGETLEELCDKHCYATAYVRGSYILMCDIKDLSTWSVVTLLLRILGSTGSHKISRGQLQLVERAIGGTYYGWGQTYLQAIRWKLNKSKTSGKDFVLDPYCVLSSLRKYLHCVRTGMCRIVVHRSHGCTAGAR